MLKLAKTLVVVTAASASLFTGCVSDIVGPVVESNSKSHEVTGLQEEFTFQAAESESYMLPVEPVAGDLDGNGTIDTADLAIFAQLLGADVTHDGAISSADAELMGSSLGLVAPEGAVETLDASQIALLARVRACDYTHDGRVDIGDYAAFSAIYELRHTGDFNHDGQVNSADTQILVKNLGHEVTPSQTPCSPLAGDLTGNGVVDTGDLAMFAQIQRADLNQDGSVNEGDLQLLASVLGQAVPEITDAASAARASRVIAADVDGNGFVDMSDVARFAYLSAMATIADLNGDGRCDSADQSLIVKNLNQVSPCA